MSAEVLIVGAGIAGVTAALNLEAQRVPFAWWDASASIGGTLRRVGNPLLNWPATQAPDGVALVAQLANHLTRRKLSPHHGRSVLSIEAIGEAGTPRFLVRSAARELEVPTVMLCTGTRPRFLGVEGEERLIGRGVEISVTRNLGRYEKAGHAVVIGGGDAAYEGALLLAKHLPRVTLLVRNKARAQVRFQRRVEAEAHIEVLQGTVSRIRSTRQGPTLELVGGGEISAAVVFVRIGVAPLIPTILPEPTFTSNGYLVTDCDGRTSVPGLYAAGDVASPLHQSAIWAAGAAARAAETIQRDRGYK